jgi:hypothetical protein
LITITEESFLQELITVIKKYKCSIVAYNEYGGQAETISFELNQGEYVIDFTSYLTAKTIENKMSGEEN